MKDGIVRCGWRSTRIAYAAVRFAELSKHANRVDIRVMSGELICPALAEARIYLYADALGSSVAETDASGMYSDGPGFNGHVTDAQTGLTYMQQR